MKRRKRGAKDHNWLDKKTRHNNEDNIPNALCDPCISGEQHLFGAIIIQGFVDLKDTKEKPGRESFQWHEWERFFTSSARRRDLETYCSLAGMDADVITSRALEVIERRGRGDKIGIRYAKRTPV